MKHPFLRTTGVVLCILLIAASALCICSCDTKTTTPTPSAPDEGVAAEIGEFENGETLGEGEHFFHFTVIDKDGSSRDCFVRTDQSTVGAALKELNLIEGEGEGDLFYVTKVLGIEANYEKDSSYWAFYSNGEYLFTGVDATPIADGEEYTLKFEVF